MPQHRAKVVIVGDGAMGKNNLANCLAKGNELNWDETRERDYNKFRLKHSKYGLEYTKREYLKQKSNPVDWEYTDNEGVLPDTDLAMEIWATMEVGLQELRELRKSSYPDTDIFLMAYDMTRKNTPENIVAHDLNDMASYKLPKPKNAQYRDGWVSEIIAHCSSDFQIILVGLKADLWDELNASGTPEQKAELTTWQQGYDVARAIGAKAYIQTSFKTYQGILKRNPDGVWLKSKMCEIRAKMLADIEVPVVEATDRSLPVEKDAAEVVGESVRAPPSPSNRNSKIIWSSTEVLDNSPKHSRTPTQSHSERERPKERVKGLCQDEDLPESLPESMSPKEQPCNCKCNLQ